MGWLAPRSGVGVPPRSVGPVTSEGLLLDIPPAEETAARARGAVWDDPNQRWCVPVGVPVEVHRFRRWIDQHRMFVDDGPSVAGRLIGLQTYCARCGVPVMAVAGVLVAPELAADPDGFVPFDDVAEALAEVCGGQMLAGRGIGPLRWRHSAAVPQGRVTNGCVGCDAVVDSAGIAQAVAEHRDGGGSLASLVLDLVVPIPVSVLEWAAGRPR